MPAIPLLAPETVLLAAGLAALLFELWMPDRHREAALVGACSALAAGLLGVLAGRGTVSLGGSVLAVDMAAQLARASVCAITALFCLWASGASGRTAVSGRAVGLTLASAAPALLAVAARDWLTLVVALEASSLPLLLLLEPPAADHASRTRLVRLVALSGVATMSIAFGVALLLASGPASGVLPAGPLSIAGSSAGGPVGWLGAAMVLAGLLAKLGTAPFDAAARPAFVEAPSSAVGLVSSLPRIAAAVGLARAAEALAPGIEGSGAILYAIGAASLAWGLAAALTERDLRGLAARSGALNAGILLFALGLAGPSGLRAAVFFAVACAAPLLGLMLVASQEGPVLDVVRGLWHRRPVAAVALAVFALSLVGIPPTAGFLGRLYILAGAWKAGATWVAVAGIAASLASAVPFGRFLRASFSSEDAARRAPEVSTPASVAALAVLAAVTVLLGLAAGPLQAVLGLRLP